MQHNYDVNIDPYIFYYKPSTLAPRELHEVIPSVVKCGMTHHKGFSLGGCGAGKADYMSPHDNSALLCKLIQTLHT